MNDTIISTKEGRRAMTPGNEVIDSVDLAGEARDYAVILSLACCADNDLDTNAVWRMADRIIKCMNKVEDLLEAEVDRRNGRAAA